MDASSERVSVISVLETLRLFSQKLESHQQVLSAVIQHQQHLHQHQLLLQRHSSLEDLQAPLTAANAAPTSPAATAQAASPATPVVAASAGCTAHTAPAGSSGQAAGSCCGAAASSPATSLVHTHTAAEAPPASARNQQGLDTASSKQENSEQLLLRGSHGATEQLAGQDMQPPCSATVLQMQLQQLQQQQQQLKAEAGAATGSLIKMLAGHFKPLMAEQEQQPSVRTAVAQPFAPQPWSAVGHSACEQQPLNNPSVPCEGSPLVPTPELLIIPGEGSASTGTTIYNFEDRQLLCSTPRGHGCKPKDFGDALEQQHDGAPSMTKEAAAAPGDTAAHRAETQQGDGAAPEAGGAADTLKHLSGHASAPQLCRHKSSAFIVEQEQILHSCSSETAEALLSISSAVNRGSNTQQGSANAAVAAGANRKKQHVDATSPSDMMSFSSTGGAAAATTAAAPYSLYVGKHDLERYASTESINTLVGSLQHNKHREQAARAAQLQHNGSFTSLRFGVDLQHNMSSQSPLLEEQGVGSPAAAKYSQHSPLPPPQQPMSASSGKIAIAAAAAGLNSLPGAGSHRAQAVRGGQLLQQNATGSLGGAASEPTPNLMPQAAGALQNAWTVPAPSTAGQSSNGGSGWNASFMCAGPDMAAMQQQALQEQRSCIYSQQRLQQMPADAGQRQQQVNVSLQGMPSGLLLQPPTACRPLQQSGHVQPMSPSAYTQQQWQQMPANARQQQQQANASLQGMSSGLLQPGPNSYRARQQSGRVQPMSASAYTQQHQAVQHPAHGAAAGNCSTSAIAAAAHTAAKVAAAKVAAATAAAAAQHAGSGAGRKRKHRGTANQASKSQCKPSSNCSSQVPAQKPHSSSFTRVSSGTPLVGLKMSRSVSTSVLLPPQQPPADSTAASSLTQFPSWLLQQAYNTFMPMTRTANTAATTAQQRDKVTTAGNCNGAVAGLARGAATTPPPAPMPTPAPATGAVAPAAIPVAGGDNTDSFFVDDAAVYLNSDQDKATGTVPCASIPTLAPTMEAAAAAAGVSLPTAAAALDNAADTAAVGTLPAGGDGLGATVYMPTASFMQLLQEPELY